MEFSGTAEPRQTLFAAGKNRHINVVIDHRQQLQLHSICRALTSNSCRC